MTKQTKKIEDMSDEELNATLSSELNALDGKAPAATESEPESDQEDSQEPTEETPAPQETQETSDDDKDGEDQGNPYRKRIDRLLRKNETIQSEAEKMRAEADAEIRALREENARLKSDDPQNTDDANETTQETDKTTPEAIAKAIAEVLDQRDMAKRTEAEKTQATAVELKELYQKFPEAIKREQELIKLSHRYPTLTFEALDTLLAPQDHVDQIEIDRKNAMNMDTSAQSRADLESDVDLTKMTTAQQEAYLRKEAEAGRLIA